MEERLTFCERIYLNNMYVPCFMMNRPEDLRSEFEKFGEVRDVYIPKDYYTRYDV